MESVLVFIDGTICDDRHRLHLYGTPEFNRDEIVLNDAAVAGSVECLKELRKQFHIIYIGARPGRMREVTEKWLRKEGFPPGDVYLSEQQENRLQTARQLSEKYRIATGIGDRWDDNELHLEIGCLSIILEEYHGNWNTVRKYLFNCGGREKPVGPEKPPV